MKWTSAAMKSDFSEDSRVCRLSRLFFSSLKINQTSWVPNAAPERIPWFWWVVLFFFFFALYGLTGALFIQRGVFAQVDVFFGSDLRWTVGDIAEFAANHYRTNTHPLGVLMVNPAGSLINRLIGSPSLTALLVSAATGAGFVVLPGIFLLRMGTSRLVAIGCSLLAGLSSAHVLWGAIPDYFLLDGLTLLFFLWVCTAHCEKLWLVIVSAVIAAGAVTTHIPLVVLIYLMARHGIRFKPVELLRNGAKFFVIVFSLTGVLAVLQDLVYPSSTLFFHPHALLSRTNYINNAGLSVRLALLMPYLVFFNMAFPAVIPVSLGEAAETGIRFALNEPVSGGLFAPAGWGFVILWTVFLIFCFIHCCRQKLFRHPFIVLAALSFGFHLVLHLFYGRPDEFFLYTPHWTFLLIATAGMILDAWMKQSKNKRFAAALLLLALIALLTMNNRTVIVNMLTLIE